MRFRHDTSFPFLKIARESGVPYRKVLEIAESIERNPMFYSRDLLFAKIEDVVASERRRRATVAHNALHNGEAP